MGLFVWLSYWDFPFPGQISGWASPFLLATSHQSTDSQRARKAGLWSASKKQNALQTTNLCTGNRQWGCFSVSLYWKENSNHTAHHSVPALPIYQLLVEYLCFFLCCHHFACLTTCLMKQLCISLHYSFSHILYFLYNTHTFRVTYDAYIHLFLHLSFIILVSISRLTPHHSVLSPEKRTPTNQSSNK